jgi:hypothetical protein
MDVVCIPTSTANCLGLDGRRRRFPLLGSVADAKGKKGREENDDKWVKFIGVRRKGERLSVMT